MDRSRDDLLVRLFYDLQQTLPLGRKSRAATKRLGPFACLPRGSYRLSWNRHPFHGPAPDTTSCTDFELLAAQALEVELP